MAEKKSVIEVLGIFEDLRAQKVDPDGKPDFAGRWYPSDEETQICCLTIRRPSLRWPYSLAIHCRTAGHVARKYGLDPAELEGAVREARKLAKAAAAGSANGDSPSA